MIRGRYLVAFALALVVAFAAFYGTVRLFGSWWRLPDMPSAEEWSAFFGISALIALAFAWYQLRQVDQSNRQLILSNEQARKITLEQIRPRVRAFWHVDRAATKKRGEPARGSIYVAIRNFGPNAATNVKLRVNPAFVSLDKFFLPGKKEEHLGKMNKVFDGSVYFDTLLPEKTYVWFLGDTPGLLDDETLGVRRYTVTVEYDGLPSGERYSDVFNLDLDIERNLSKPVAPLDRIGKDLEVLGDKIDKVIAKM